MELGFETQEEQLCNSIIEFVQSFMFSHKNMKSQKVIRIADSETISRLRHTKIPEKSRPVQEVIDEMMQDVYPNQLLVQHPRWFGCIPSPVSLLSWLGDIMTNAYDPHAGSWMQCSSASCIEQEVISWMCRQAGYPAAAGGIFVSGGSMANLTALTAARHARLSESEYTRGVAYISGQTHSSAYKGLRIMGLRIDQIRTIPVDSTFRMDRKALEMSVCDDIAAGNIPFAIIATAGTTNTGSIDPLNEIADICQKYNIWMHVDGAYGASVLVSPKYKECLNGIERSDSISWDAHKWLMQTYGCSAILVKEKKHLLDCFCMHPEYLEDVTTQNGQTDYWDMGIELTRPARSLKLWLTLQVLGTDAVGKVIEHGFQLAKWAEAEIKKYRDWEIISPAQLAIINFRYAPSGLDDQQLNTLNQQISQEILEDGYVGVLTTELNGKKVLRICAIHPETTQKDMRTTVKLLNTCASRIYSEMNPQSFQMKKVCNK